MVYLLYFITFFALSIALEMAARYPQIRAYFTHIERGRGSRKQVLVVSEADAMKALLKKYPYLQSMIDEGVQKGELEKQEQTTTEQPQTEKPKPKVLPLY